MRNLEAEKIPEAIRSFTTAWRKISEGRGMTTQDLDTNMTDFSIEALDQQTGHKLHIDFKIHPLLQFELPTENVESVITSANASARINVFFLGGLTAGEVGSIRNPFPEKVSVQTPLCDLPVEENQKFLVAESLDLQGPNNSARYQKTNLEPESHVTAVSHGPFPQAPYLPEKLDLHTYLGELISVIEKHANNPAAPIEFPEVVLTADPAILHFHQSYPEVAIH